MTPPKLLSRSRSRSFNFIQINGSAYSIQWLLHRVPKLEHQAGAMSSKFQRDVRSRLLVAPPSAVAWHFSNNFALLIVMARNGREKSFMSSIEICACEIESKSPNPKNMQNFGFHYFRFEWRYYCTIELLQRVHGSSAEIIVDWWIFHLNFFAPRHRSARRGRKKSKALFQCKVNFIIWTTTTTGGVVACSSSRSQHEWML